MVAKLQGCYTEMDSIGEELSELKATGLVEGFEMSSGSTMRLLEQFGFS